MSGKNQAPVVINWQTVDPRTGFLPLNNNTAGRGSLPSGTLDGAMASTNTIYSNIVDISRMDNEGIEVAWSGDPTGTFSVLVSVSGINWDALTFDPALAQPDGSAGNMYINLTQLGAKYILFQYVNSNGLGSLTTFLQVKDLN